ncbi:Tlg1 protein [Starmerella bacillaris]|uniref:t-SNARE affecting a late Golgi compartment protein 1 n=1 Tax=Starmerella bacillaris TaxID=1247836 RepID=A0AAV5RDV8_STABA|nr:Tlg1 protein [Starmerella bacillaris]
MDPFAPVLKEAESQLSSAQLKLRQYRSERSASTLNDVHNTIKDLTETIRELSLSIAAVQSSPERFGLSTDEIDRRIEQVGHINNQVTDIQEELAGIKGDSRAFNTTQNDPFNSGFEGNNENENVTEEDRQLLFQSTLNEQDTILDEVERTVMNLREQANVMSQELDDQADLLDDFETHVDSTNDRISRGVQRVNWILKHNRDTASNCCIGLLIVALVILLVLVVAT